MTAKPVVDSLLQGCASTRGVNRISLEKHGELYYRSCSNYCLCRSDPR